MSKSLPSGEAQGGHTPKIAIFAPQNPDCSCWKRLFNTEFEAEAFSPQPAFAGTLRAGRRIADRSETDLIKKVREEATDAAVICLCSSPENEIDNIA